MAAATLADDLRRRDFTINAMAVALRATTSGTCTTRTAGSADLETGFVRILHQSSFLDDPTRLLRAVRYETRLGFRMDEDSERAARVAVAEDALSTVSGARVRDELMDLLAEHEAPAAVERLRELGLDRALHPALEPDPELVASASLGAAAIGADRGIASLAALVAGDIDRTRPVGCRPPARGARARCGRARRPGRAADRCEELRAREHVPSELRDLLGDEPPEALALALALGAPSEPILRWVDRPQRRAARDRRRRPAGRGRPGGPGGRAARSTRRCGASSTASCSGRDDELRTALELAR